MRCVFQIFAVCLAVACARASAETTYEFEGKRVRMEACLPGGQGQVPAVLVLPGSLGFAPDAATGKLCDQYASALMKRGIAAYIVHFQDGGPYRLPGGKNPDARAVRAKDKVEWMPDWTKVVDAGIVRVGKQPRVDANRIGLLGFSLGASVSYGVSSEDSRVKAVVGFYGDMLPPAYAKKSGAMAPTMIFQGETDTECPPRNATELASFLKSKGVFHRLHLYPGVGHSFNKDPSAPLSKEVLKLTLDFFQKHLGGAL